MKNFIAVGDTIPMTAPDETDGDVAAGEGVLNGSIFGVAVTDIAAGEEGPCKLSGVFELAKVSAQAWAIKGVKLYWDEATKLVTSTAASNKAIGSSYAPADNPSDTGLVLLNGGVAIN